MDFKTIGKYSFIAGIALALIGVFTNLGDTGAILVGLLGLVGGFTRVSKGSETHFLVLAVALHFLSPFIGTWPQPEIGEYFLKFLASMDALLAMAALAVIFRNFYHWVVG